MGHICSTSALSWQFGSSTGCGRCHLRLAGRAGGGGLVTAAACRSSHTLLGCSTCALRCYCCCCRQSRHYGLAISGRNCCFGHCSSFSCCCLYPSLWLLLRLLPLLLLQCVLFSFLFFPLFSPSSSIIFPPNDIVRFARGWVGRACFLLFTPMQNLALL
jgi:hypothetical protein